ncbi:glycosyltransferase family 2 protein [Rhizobium skierniewicense]|uniref:glycosyltransferase family 2 protein n=1 Tax=Rhizobium skierniewicense TaxID=984260 RepID=UPI001571BEC6|nr:glycosyltransferase family 2 protein [Rhizobium skierniewicense]NTF32442.1 glycosyltransferase [Rhizobium skierniewicense]
MSSYFIEYWQAHSAGLAQALFVFSCWFAFFCGLWTVVTTTDVYRVRWASRYDVLQVHGIAIAAAALSSLAVPISDLVPAVSIVVIISLFLAVFLLRLSAAGLSFVIAGPLSTISGSVWAYKWLNTNGYPSFLVLAIVLLGVISIFRIAFVIYVQLGTFGLLVRKQWSRPVAPHPASQIQRRVSIHVPVHAEPAHIVIETLKSIARLDYDNFEVLVCDNNTVDGSLWKPVEAYCETLNDAIGEKRFRFFHVEGLTGAKAGALNLCLDHTDPSAELIALVDSDYLCEPGFLSDLVPFFDEPRFGFVQTSHDYRSNEANVFNRACYWEYMVPNRLEYAGASEMQASFTIGTMCVFRKSAIEEAGRWAEWCQTEDSEIAIRIRAAGYDGLFLPYTYGRGLMPDNFADWKKQRFRWTYGPVQQLRRHWRLLLPVWLGGSPNLKAWGKCYEVVRSLVALIIPVGLVGNVVFAAAYPVLVWQGMLPSVQIPSQAIFFMGLILANGVLRSVAEYRICGCHKLSNMLAAELAALALRFVWSSASVYAAVGRKIEWRRTPKFLSRQTVWSALSGASTELALAMSLLPVVGLIIYVGQFIQWSDIAISIAALIYPLVTFAAAPIMALLALGGGSEKADHFRDKRYLPLPPATARPVLRLAGAEIPAAAKVLGEA